MSRHFDTILVGARWLSELSATAISFCAPSFMMDSDWSDRGRIAPELSNYDSRSSRNRNRCRSSSTACLKVGMGIQSETELR
jgi:hypothetical protein